MAKKKREGWCPACEVWRTVGRCGRCSICIQHNGYDEAPKLLAAIPDVILKRAEERLRHEIQDRFAGLLVRRGLSMGQLDQFFYVLTKRFGNTPTLQEDKLIAADRDMERAINACHYGSGSIDQFVKAGLFFGMRWNIQAHKEE